MVSNAAIELSTPGFMAPQIWQMMTQQANVLVKSGFLPTSIKSPEQALAIMMVGSELGIQPWQALSTINVIQGKPTISPQLMLALIQRSGQLENITIESLATSCVVQMKRKGQTAHVETFTIEDAAKMQLSGKDNWKKQPATMLKWRAVAACARVVFPDVILGLYTPEEMGAEVIETEQGEIVVQKPEPELKLVAPEVTEAEIVPDQKPAKPEKPKSQFQWLMENVKHPRYQASEARARAIQKLQAADLIFEAQPHEQALKLVVAYGNLRDNEASENDAVLEVRKLANTKGEA